jgi:hypothetical protein
VRPFSASVDSSRTHRRRQESRAFPLDGAITAGGHRSNYVNYTLKSEKIEKKILSTVNIQI